MEQERRRGNRAGAVQNLSRVDGDGYDINAQTRAIDVHKGFVTDASGRKWSCKTQDLGIKFNYELPKDQFRKPYYSRNVKVTFEALEVPALGYKAFGWVNGKSAFGADPLSGSRSLIVGEREMANDRFHVEIGANGTVKLTDKASGTVYKDLCAYENVSDMGNEYIFVQAKGTEALTTFGLNAEVRVLEDAPFRATMEIVHEWLVPKGATAELETEMLEVVPLQERVAQRSDENVTLADRHADYLREGRQKRSRPQAPSTTTRPITA